MDYPKNSITNLAILSLAIATLFFIIFSWNPYLSSHAHSPHTNKSFIQEDELQIALDKSSMLNKTVIIVIINKAYVEPHENEYPAMLDLFLEGFWAGEETRPLVDNLLVVAIDKTAHERCLYRQLNCYKLAGDEGDEFSGEQVYMSDEFIKMMWRRTLFLQNVLKRGYNFIFTDADVLWLRNPLTRLLKNETIDLHISTDVFNGNASSEKNLINTGFYFIRSNNKTISLFEKWYDMRKNSTGLKEQDVLDNLVRQGVLGQLGIQTIFLDTLYFSGFCCNSKDVKLVCTVHANCCQTIGAKVADLKVALRDWEKFKSKEEIGNGSDLRHAVGDFSHDFKWSKHVSCISSWDNKTLPHGLGN